MLTPNLKLRLAVSLSSDPGQRRNFEVDVNIFLSQSRWATLYIFSKAIHHNWEAKGSPHEVHRRSTVSVDLPDVEVDPVVVEVLLEEDRLRRLRQRLRSAVASPRTRTLLRGLKHIIALRIWDLAMKSEYRY